MCATAEVARNWKRVFLALEAFIVFAILYGVTLRGLWRYDVGEHPLIMSIFQPLKTILIPMFWTLLVVVSFLLLVSPFFLRSLRATALKAWLIGAIGLVYLAGILFGWWLR